MKLPRKAKHLCHTHDMPSTVVKLHPTALASFVTPPKDVKKHLWKVAVLKAKQQSDKAMKLSESLKGQFKSIKDIAKYVGDDEKAIYRLLSPPRKRIKEEYIRKLSDEVKDEVERIYNYPEVTYCLPDMKLSGFKFMSCTLSKAHQIYLAKCRTKRKVAEKTFAALKPKYMKTIQETLLRGCHCEYCANFSKSRQTLIGFGIKGIPCNHSAAIDKSLCLYRRNEPDDMDICNPYVCDELPGKNCIKRTCDNCSIEKYQEQVMKENITLIQTLKRVSWQQWGDVRYLGRDGKSKKKTALITYYGSVAKLLALYFKQLKMIAMHQFQKLWQLQNFNMTLRYLQCGQVLFVHDFQMNLMLFCQDEPAGTHWDHPQITVHPTLAFFCCWNSNCNKIVHEDIIHISDVLTHDKHAVNAFVTKSIQHLKAKGVPIQEIIKFTDQASGQYKSKIHLSHYN